MSNTPTPVRHLTNPFVGLRAFEESEDYLFFGRSIQIGELLKKFSDSRFLAVIGSSGSGKSSLVKSGLLPAIYSGFMTVGSNWRVGLLRPGENPIGYLTKELAGEGTLYTGIKDSDIPYESIIESGLRRSENGLVRVYKDAHLNANENLLIVVDQFEELFRFSKYEKENKLGKSDAIHFIKILLTAAQQRECPVYVLLTMRSDFLGDCAEFRGLPEAINKGQYLVPRMIRDEIREAITGPVAVSNVTISQRLVTRLLNDIDNDTDQLPILQHAMMRTWDAWYERNQPGTPIDFEDYEKIGTMKSALSQHADEAYTELTKEKEQQTCELMFKALTDKAADVRGTRRPRSIADLSRLTGGTQTEVINLVDVFRKRGRTFLMPPPNVKLTDKSIIDISHESLMRVWERLVKWTEEEARSGDVYVRLANSAKLNEQHQRGLLKNPELEITLKWKEKNNPTAKWAEGYKGNFEQAMTYLEDSRKQDLAEQEIIKKRTRTRKGLVIGFVTFLTMVAILLGFLTNSARNEKIKADKSNAQAILARIAADTSAAQAIRAKIAADTSAARAGRAQVLADTNASRARQAKIDADTNAARARLAQVFADTSAAREGQAKTEAVNALAEIKKQSLKIAANEYPRLIREGPSVENKNSKEFYGSNYFLAYCYHFNQLGDLVAAEDQAALKSLKNKLYYNNDLYLRVYKNFEDLGSLSTVIKKDNSSNPDFSSISLDNNESVRLNEKSLSIFFTVSNADKYVVEPNAGTGQKFNSFTVSKKQHLIFCSTNDNFIYVFNDKLEKVGTISMGVKVTALDFNDENSIIYFGASSGYIGYIKYRIDRKNQPIFENKLETEITAVQLFKRSHKDKLNNGVTEETFLLATGKKSSPKVYKLEESSLTPDSRLIGNELPYKKEYGDITNAKYISQINRVILVTSTGTYSWNPFTDELLDKLEEKENFDPESSKTKELINKTQIY